MDKNLEKALKQKEINQKAYEDVSNGKEPSSNDSFYVSCYNYWTSMKEVIYDLR